AVADAERAGLLDRGAVEAVQADPERDVLDGVGIGAVEARLPPLCRNAGVGAVGPRTDISGPVACRDRVAHRAGPLGERARHAVRRAAWIEPGGHAAGVDGPHRGLSGCAVRRLRRVGRADRRRQAAEREGEGGDRDAPSTGHACSFAVVQSRAGTTAPASPTLRSQTFDNACIAWWDRLQPGFVLTRAREVAGALA